MTEMQPALEKKMAVVKKMIREKVIKEFMFSCYI